MKHRLNKGLSIEGVCTAPVTQEWKMRLMAREVFDTLWSDKKNVLRIANELLEMSMEPEPGDNLNLSIMEVRNKISEAKARQDRLLELRLSDEITKEMFQEKSAAIDKEIFGFDDELTRLKKISNSSYNSIEAKINSLKEALEQGFDFEKNDVPDTVIDAFVDEIRVTDDSFEWKLNIAGKSVTHTVKKNTVIIHNRI